MFYWSKQRPGSALSSFLSSGPMQSGGLLPYFLFLSSIGDSWVWILCQHGNIRFHRRFYGPSLFPLRSNPWHGAQDRSSPPIWADSKSSLYIYHVIIIYKSFAWHPRQHNNNTKALFNSSTQALHPENSNVKAARSLPGEGINQGEQFEHFFPLQSKSTGKLYKLIPVLTHYAAALLPGLSTFYVLAVPCFHDGNTRGNSTSAFNAQMHCNSTKHRFQFRGTDFCVYAPSIQCLY